MKKLQRTQIDRSKEREKARTKAKAKKLQQRAAKAKAQKLRERLTLPIVPPQLMASAAYKERSIKQVATELLTFSAVDDAVRRSHRHYHDALGKVYATWFELLAWPERDRDRLLIEINDAIEQKTERGDGLHVLLRALIDYGGVRHENLPPDERRAVRQSALRRIGRDAHALKFAARNRVAPDGFIAFVSKHAGGLDRMAREETQARRNDATVTVKDRPPRMRIVWPKGLEEAVLDAFVDSEGVALFLTVGEVEGTFKVAVAHSVNRSAENWCDRLRDLDLLMPAPV